MGYVTLFLSALSIACGLYCAAEIAEEYSSMSLKVIKGTLGFVGVCHFLCLFSGVGEKERERERERATGGGGLYGWAGEGEGFS